MSKEQTLTAEELIRNSDLWLKERGQFEGVIELMEQYAQAKVLEALEIVKTLTDHNVSVTSEHIDNLIRNKTKV